MDRCLEEAAAVMDRPCLIFASRPGLTPIETVLVVIRKSDKRHCNRLLKPFYMGKKLMVMAGAELSFPEAWLWDCWKRGVRVSEFVRQPFGEDLLYLDIFYVLFSIRHRNWVSDRLQKHVEKETGLKETGALVRMLKCYLEKNGYEVNPFSVINKANGAVYLSDSSAERAVYQTLEICDRLGEKLLERCLRALVLLHRMLSEKRYFSSVKAIKEFSGAGIRVLNKKGESSSGCAFLHIRKEEADWFVKGNECPVFHSMENEIVVQKRLLSKENNGNFLCMKQYDPSFRWICYPFERKRTLRHILRERLLTMDERERLGEFLIATLDQLYAMNIVHRDFRIENIMAEESKNGVIQSFQLFDFGSAVMDGVDIWAGKSFWNRYLSRQVCGEGRYNEQIVDDAAAACMVYMKCGGDYEDETVKQIEKRIGRLIV